MTQWSVTFQYQETESRVKGKTSIFVNGYTGPFDTPVFWFVENVP